jgi:hypothetical protein
MELPAHRAGLAVAPPVGDSPQLVAGRFNLFILLIKLHIKA